MKSRLWPIAIHILFGAAFLALPYIFAPSGFNQLLAITHNPHERTNLLSYILMLGFFYLNYYLLIPKLYFAQKYLWYALSTLFSFGIVVLMLITVDRQDVFPGSPSGAPPQMSKEEQRPPELVQGQPPNLPSPQYRKEKPPFGFELSHALFLFLVGIFVSLSLRINDRLKQTEREKLNTELSFLKAQINPHFLFNILNTIYSLAIEQSNKTADAVVKLSSLMRYVMREADTEFVPLVKEFNYIENYIALQQLRLDDTAEIDFKIEGHPNGQQIAPLILISFIENVFKYGVNPQEKSRIQVHLSIAENHLHLRTFNRKVRVFHDEDASRIGLENTQTRLKLLYPNKHLLILNETAQEFTVELTLHLES